MARKRLEKVNFKPKNHQTHIGDRESTVEILKNQPYWRFSPWKINGWNLQITHLMCFRKENDLPNLHDYVPC